MVEQINQNVSLNGYSWAAIVPAAMNNQPGVSNFTSRATLASPLSTSSETR